MNLSPQNVESFKNLLEHPEKNGLDFPALSEIFKEAEKATPKHMLYEQYLSRIKRKKGSVPKVLFYIIMDGMYKQKISDDGNLGYCVEIIEESENQTQ